MKILVLGSGGREHAIIWKLAQSKYNPELFCAPGNGGIASLAECVPIDVMDKESIMRFVRDRAIDMVVVAPENPLAAGMVDFLTAGGVRAFGPNKEASQLEASKEFSKKLMAKYDIPTAAYEIFTDSTEAITYLRRAEQTFPAVIKADGLAVGKGVIIAKDIDEAEKAVKEMLDEGKFGASGKHIVIEEYLTGPEMTMLAFADGNKIVPMVSSQDHKRVNDNDEGPNTGGMGAISPSRHYTAEVERMCRERIYDATARALKAEGIEFKGVIYFGMMLTDKGPYVIEYNARFGDPETQCILPRLRTDLVDIFNAVIDGQLSELEIEWSDEACACVVMASGGYPTGYQKGYEISGIEAAESDGEIVFHAGTALKDGKYYNAGGRVLGVTAMADTLDQALAKAYCGVGKIDWKDVHYRRDIGKKV